jgi:hypothetical protein
VVDLDNTKRIDIADAAAMAVFPELKAVNGAGSGYQFMHWADGTGVPITITAGPGSLAYIGKSVSLWGSTLRVVPSELGWVYEYSDASCTLPAVSADPSSLPAAGSVFSKQSTACVTLPGAASPNTGAWKVPSSPTAPGGNVYQLTDDGTCISAGTTTRVLLTDASSEIETLLPPAPLKTF